MIARAEALHREQESVTENELISENNVSYIRRGKDESISMRIEKYLGEKSLLNTKYGTTYLAHVWKVHFHTTNGRIFWTPLPGLLQVKKDDWVPQIPLIQSRVGSLPSTFTPIWR